MILIPSTEVMLSDIVPIRKGKSRGSTKKDSKKTTKLKSFNPVWGDQVTFCVYGNMPIICRRLSAFTFERIHLVHRQMFLW